MVLITPCQPLHPLHHGNPLLSFSMGFTHPPKESQNRGRHLPQTDPIPSDWREADKPAPWVPPGNQPPCSLDSHSGSLRPPPHSHLSATAYCPPSLGDSTDPVVIPSGLPRTQLRGALGAGRSDPLQNCRSRRLTAASQTHHTRSGRGLELRARLPARRHRSCAPRTTTPRMPQAFSSDGAGRQTIRGGAIARTSPSPAPASLSMPWQWRKQEEKTALTTRDTDYRERDAETGSDRSGCDRCVRTQIWRDRAGKP